MWTAWQPTIVAWQSSSISTLQTILLQHLFTFILSDSLLMLFPMGNYAQVLEKYENTYSGSCNGLSKMQAVGHVVEAVNNISQEQPIPGRDGVVPRVAAAGH